MWKKIFKIFNSSDLIKNSFILLSGTVIAQIFVYVSYPILCRFFNPADFGIYAIYLNIVNVLQVVSTGRYEITIMLPKNNNDAKSLFNASLIIGGFFLLLLFLLIFLLHSEILVILNNSHLYNWIWFIPVSIYMIGVYQTTNYWLLRNKKFKQSSFLKIVQTLSISLISLILGLLKIKYGLIIGYLIGNLIMILFCFYTLIQNNFFQQKNSKTRMFANIKKYKDYPIFNLLPALANTSSSSLPIFYINSFYGDHIVGYVNLARQIISSPISFISVSFSQVYFEKLIKTKNDGKLIFEDFLKITKVLSSIAFIFFILVSLTAFWAFKYIFGTSWDDAGIYASIMSVSVSIQFVVTPLSILCPALDRIRLASVWQFFLFIIITSLYFAKSLDSISFFILYIFVESIAYIIYFILIFKIVKEYDKKLKYSCI